jgi:hypothetical protein
MASELEEGLDWVLDRHLAQPEPRKPAVVSMSLLVASDTTAADLIAQKVEELIDAGVTIVAAAGNYHEGALRCASAILQHALWPCSAGACVDVVLAAGVRDSQQPLPAVTTLAQRLAHA